MPTVAINTATQSDAALRININGRVEVRPAIEANTALSVTPVSINDTHLFNFPTQGAFSVEAIIGPKWKLYFYDAVTGAEEPVFADAGFMLAHTQPVTINRKGEMPVMYVQEGVGYRVVIKNQYGVEKHRIDYFEWPDVAEKFAVLGIASEVSVASSITPA